MTSGVRRRIVSHPLEDLTVLLEARAESQRPPQGRRGAIQPGVALLLLLGARLCSAAFNILHDCDEAFNYLEPLHYLLYGYGMQTWEYSSHFALRPYLYLLLHGLVGGPAAVVFGSATGKVAVFYAIKVALALLSALTEWWLYRAVQRQYPSGVSNGFLALLCLSTGMFVCSTGILPSSFTMYALTAAAAAVLEGKPYHVIAAAVIGVVCGWCVAGIAFLPYALYVLATAKFVRAVATGVVCLLGTVVPLVLVDRVFYGKWTASLLNFIQYNVVGGGESALYGVEGPSFYLRNGFNNFTLALPLALLLPLLAPVAGNALRLGGKSVKGKVRAEERRSTLRLMVCLSPLYVWLAAITALAHKEERFLFVVYPLICLAAAASLAVLTSWASRILARLFAAPTARSLAQLGARAVLAVLGLLALSRSAALVLNYGAPMTIYRHLPEVLDNNTLQHVCVGAEWHRFPSSFFLPGPAYRLQFIKSGFTGLLPRPFDPSQGGTAAAPRQMNDKNREEPENYWDSPAGCDYLVTLQDGSQHIDNLGGLIWEPVASQPFVDVAKSPALARAFYIPGWSPKRNHYVQYVLMKLR